MQSGRPYPGRAAVPFFIVGLGLLAVSWLNDSWLGHASGVALALMVIGWSFFWWRRRDVTSTSDAIVTQRRR
jgi:hypothetical protein